MVRKSSSPLAILSLLALASTIGAATAGAAEIKALFPFSLQHADAELMPRFEQASGDKVAIAYSTAGVVASKVRRGEPTDVAISSAKQIEQLQQEGKIASGTAVRIAKVGVGALVRKGAPKPDIGTLEKFKAAMLAARAIAYTDPALGGPAGIHVAKLMEQLGIGPEMKQKTKLSGPGAAVSTAVVNGEADIGFIMINEILADPRVDFVAPLPSAVQDYTVFTGGALAASAQQPAGRALLAFLSSSTSRAVMERLGFEMP